MDTIRKRKWFWTWQDAQEEAWLQNMSRHGLHLKKIGVFGAYSFELGDPVDFVYRLDFKDNKQGQAQYQQLFADAGWEHVAGTTGWQYFRKAAVPGEELEIFSDTDSKVQKYERVKTFMYASMPTYLLLFIVAIENTLWLTILLTLILIGSMIFYAIALAKIEERVKQLKML